MFVNLCRYIGAFFIIFTPLAAYPAIYPLPSPGNDIIGEVFAAKAKPGDTLSSIGLRYGMSVHEMMEANPGVNANIKLRGGQSIVVPAQFILPPQRAGIVVNMAELRLYYFPPQGKYVMTYPVAMGRDEWRTPIIATKVVSKVKDPVWRVPDSIRQFIFENKGELLPEAIQPGPDNPLGHYAIYLGANGYLIHGNNAPSSIGKFVSSGCIRMNNSDITTLYKLVAIGTPVYIIHYPYKAGWFNGDLYLEAQVPVELAQESSGLNETSPEEVINAELRTNPGTVDWSAVQKVVKNHIGIPEPVGRSSTQQASLETHPPLAIKTTDGTSVDLFFPNDPETITFSSN